MKVLNAEAGTQHREVMEWQPHFLKILYKEMETDWQKMCQTFKYTQEYTTKDRGVLSLCSQLNKYNTKQNIC